MPITVPVVESEISVSTFGKPVADQVNANTTDIAASASKLSGGMGANAITTACPAVTVPAGVNSLIVDKTFTVPAALHSVLVIWSVTCNAAGVGDLLIAGPGTTYNSQIPAISGAVSGAGTFIKAAGATTLNIKINIYAWGGGQIVTDTSKSNFVVQTLGFSARNTLVFPS